MYVPTAAHSQTRPKYENYFIILYKLNTNTNPIFICICQTSLLLVLSQAVNTAYKAGDVIASFSFHSFCFSLYLSLSVLYMNCFQVIRNGFYQIKYVQHKGSVCFPLSCTFSSIIECRCYFFIFNCLRYYCNWC